MKKILILLLFIVSVSFIYAQNENKLVILHTNDTHSQIEAYGKQAGDNYGKAGVARRAAYIKTIEKDYPNVLILDAGDFVQGTPYFNMFGGEVEIEAMNKMGYDVVTLGNHEFDNGINFLAAMLQNADFEVVSANYDVTATALKDLVKPYTIKEINGFKVGIIGLGVRPFGLISDKNFEGIRFLDPIETANKYAKELKEEKDVDMVIALTHLGFESERGFSDKSLAKNSKNIDLIVGGHSHTYLKEPVVIENLDGKKVLITQTGSKGMNVGKLIFDLNK
ncbi:MAG: bifunctional metallophosphatase/5'-nucleotidase [Bacteroidales bacterium]